MPLHDTGTGFQRRQSIVTSTTYHIFHSQAIERPLILSTTGYSTNPHLSNAGVVIARPRAQSEGPVIDVNVLHVCATLCNSVRDKDVVQLFVILVEDVGIPLHDVDIGVFVDFHE